MNRSFYGVFLVSCLFCFSALAMKPSPFADVDSVQPKSKMRLISQRKDPQDELGLEGFTKALNRKGKTLWEADFFLGRKNYSLSADGKTLMVYGNVYFGDQVNDQDQDRFIVVYEKGKEKKVISFQEITGVNLNEYVAKNKVPLIGGGWYDLQELFPEIKLQAGRRRVVVSRRGLAPKEFRY